jgi:hypothetical protein
LRCRKSEFWLDQRFRWRERHCITGIGNCPRIGIRAGHEDRNAACGAHNAQDHKGNNQSEPAEYAGGRTDIAKLGMQITREGHSTLLCCDPSPNEHYTAKIANKGGIQASHAVEGIHGEFGLD